MEVLAPAVRRALDLGGPEPGPFGELSGFKRITRVVVVDQSPIGRSPRSTPATYSGIVDPLRSVYAQTREAKARGYAPNRFSFNHKSGQCAECKGLGAKRIELSFLPDQYVVCSTCRGRRFNAATQEIRFKGRNIAESLAMTISEAAEFFENHPKIAKPTRTLSDIGLGYLTLDQWATTLSGGEAQRLKLGTELARGDLGSTLFVLDEPTTGLHFHDVGQLAQVFRRLTADGHTVLVIEHHLDLIRAADWVVDLGPEGGAAGGRIIVEGTPAEIALAMASATGAALSHNVDD
jgi:excinuclease ABC subunit A